MALIHQKKRKFPIIILGALITAVVVIVLLYFFVGKKDKKEEGVITIEDETVSELATTEEIETTIEYEMKSKEYYIDYVEVGDEQETNEFLDIRIRFPNGEDYIVVTGKTITYVTEEGFYMYLDEQELHMLSSARTDVEVYQGAKLYLASYTKKQENSQSDYPVNLFVLSAYTNYFTEVEQIYSRRLQLEENLLTFMNQTLQK